MKIQIKNLGPLDEAEFVLGDFTIICGANNTGKTYATYALFGFLSFWQEGFDIGIKKEFMDELFSEGVVQMDIMPYVEQIKNILNRASNQYRENLPMVFAADSKRFKETSIAISVEAPDNNDIINQKYERRISSANSERFLITKSTGNNNIEITLLVDKQRIQIPKGIVSSFVSDSLKAIIFRNLVPKPFIISAERTGAAIFRKELNFARNRLFEKMGQTDQDLDPMDLFRETYSDYALPVKRNVDFMRQLESIAKEDSFIAKNYPELLSDFADIIGGDYLVTRNDELYYIPKNKKRLKLTMDESSSSVRSLLDLGFYLKHVAQKGDLLIMDEPELNLHPENQRRVARLLARLVNLGIKVFITTHSDYLVRELNTLIMLKQDKPHLQRIATQEGYRAEEFLAPSQIKMYIAEDDLVKREGNKRKTHCHTLTPAQIDSEWGIEARSFDTTINIMNRIQQEILFGGSNGE